eukprot:72029-Rhodomonas_salina.1
MRKHAQTRTPQQTPQTHASHKTQKQKHKTKPSSYLVKCKVALLHILGQVQLPLVLEHRQCVRLPPDWYHTLPNLSTRKAAKMVPRTILPDASTGTRRAHVRNRKATKLILEESTCRQPQNCCDGMRVEHTPVPADRRKRYYRERLATTYA